ncbi:transcription initiation factor IID, 31kD subunit-domain-containing protein [Talaromyces proteolyticus]|uniref:Transcription initiation factor IID, 31kD subunit-domain-containing protein n=1 Tax=Talaromyces proteolyticus TaxID=1131652 RepID=A0AAD4KU33_9EURO|nr:transcription initiation factor IID, 31kD subunit-domain-containing protein [Talaromyces proteolyticus]KAH8698815.1 transcription initiation factor IID, 31kD subunit-domain-containing protein [Talaromyces proteolyticus]
MATPRPTQAAGSTQPLTPPDDPTTTNNTSSQAAAASAPNSSIPSAPAMPSTSLTDTGKSRRPRDSRLVHMLLASLGVTGYQERVPLQLLDFAYRYTSSTLQDAAYLAMEGYAGSTSGPGETNVSTGGGRGGVELNTVTLQSLRLSIASRLHYQFQPGLSKEFLVDVASERNRYALPGVARGGETAAKSGFSNISMGGMRLPPEKFCQTGTGWNLKEEWESEGEDDVEDAAEPTVALGAAGQNDEEDLEDEGDGRMEDVFGEDAVMKEGDEDDEHMADA